LPQSKQINALSNNSNEVKTTASPSPSSPSQATTSAKVTTSIQATISQASNSSVIIDSIDSENIKLSVKEMIELAKINEFPKNIVQIGDYHKALTPILQFFEFAEMFCEERDDNISFKCKIFEKTYKAVLTKTTNLNKHLKTHDELDEWFRKYENYKQPKKTVIEDTNLKLIKYFISSNEALKELKKKGLTELISEQL
jgi:hypothetical protein